MTREYKRAVAEPKDHKPARYSAAKGHLSRAALVGDYWEQKGVNRGDKEQWARMRCSDVAFSKGFREHSCRLYGDGKEALGHIKQCQKEKDQTRVKRES